LYLNQIKDRFAILETRTNKKIKVRTDTTDFMALANIWLLEDYKIKKFEIRSNDVIVDIGAHIGIFTIYASQFCNNGKIYSFEPVKENYDLLLNNIELNRLEQVKPFELIDGLKQILAKQGFQVVTKVISNELVLLYAIKDGIILC
jgi:tRNA1(Val) A37 N6-methylase TrmN6